MNEKEENAKIVKFLESERKQRQKQESTTDVAERVEKKLQVTATHEKNKFPILEKSLVHHEPNENICVNGVVAKPKRELHVKET